MTSRVRVRWPLEARGLASWSGIIGFVGGVVLSLAFERPGLPQLVFMPFLFRTALEWGIPIAAAVLLAVRFAFACQRLPLVYLSGHCVTSAYVGGLIFTRAALAPGGAAGSWIAYAIALSAILLVGVFGGIANCVICLVIRSIVTRIIEQDGALCWKCAYRIGSPPASARCPECGTQVAGKDKDETLIWRVFSLPRRHVRVVAVALGVVALGVLMLRFGSARGPTTGFIDKLGGRDRMLLGVMFGSQRPGVAWEAVGVWQPIEGETTMVLMGYVEAEPAPGQPIAQLRVGAQITNRLGHVFADDGEPLVLCDLQSDQAAYVTMNGVPTSLIDAMVSAAAAAGWKPSVAGAIRGAKMVVVPADPYFTDTDE